ncbi:putative 2OG-Fe(II) oxygenase [Deinococcus sp.]|uniref:putative 2OG-Fe(II) oxygenase n=1 Tax=Deinococcus sp. TaxID=47478 RepID=UPI003CC6D58C
MTAASDLKLLWPTPLLQRELPGHAAVNAGLLDLFARHRQQVPGPPGNVYSSSDDLLARYSDPHLQALFAFVSQAVFDVASRVNAAAWAALPAARLRMEVVGAWFQVQNRYGFHDIHTHGNCSWSGVYYVQIDDEALRARHPHLGARNGVTRFYGPLWSLLGGAYQDLGNVYLQQGTFDVQPSAGTLIVFPSWLNHKAMPYDGEQDRVIVSFNAQVHGAAGDRAAGYGFG